MTTTSSTDLAALVLPWADMHHPDKATQTRSVESRPDVYRRYLLRLVEIRWHDDPSFRLMVSTDVLDETAITARWRTKSGTVLDVGGAKAPGPRRWAWGELTMLMNAPDSLESLAAIKDILDLETVEVGPTKPLPPPIDYSRRRQPLPDPLDR